ncbi:hypothetical protein Agub_g13461 [Astrephomene gubernaculifera]|uniref:Metallo-beta-lactamase domain-containing protein n=1 Tax=Astrephomene gubernaculifera TaxID=47775 RepID=A0AAD3HRJ3_9CHLO|nr:hypothetical protein Agub_g13461 [Astrephomene gubernaculifera]
MLPYLITRQAFAFTHRLPYRLQFIKSSTSSETTNRLVGAPLRSALTPICGNLVAMSTAPAKTASCSEGHDALHGNAVLPSHHVENPGLLGPRFRNPWDTFEGRSFSEVMRWHRERRQAGGPAPGHLMGIPKPTEADYRRAFPLHPVDWSALASPPAGGLQAVWVGHATVLVQMGGVNLITDPVFSDRCAPVQFAGPKRVVPPALTGLEPQLPPLDLVLISHNHYDHLDTATVRTLHRRYGKSLTWFVPLGLRPWFRSEGVPAAQVVELDWWQRAEHTCARTGASVTVTMVPAQHWSARGVLDRFRTLWGGYVVSTPPQQQQPQQQQSSTPHSQQQQQQQQQHQSQEGKPDELPPPTSSTSSPTQVAASSRCCAGSRVAPAPVPAAATTSTAAAAAPTAPAAAAALAAPLKFFFAGDTGYCSVFREVGERLGPIDLAAIPIGAYEPRWFMRPQHVDAVEGLQISRDVRAAVSIGIHTATWALTDEPLDEPPKKLQEAVAAAGLPPSSFVTLQHGERAVVVGGRLVNNPATLPVQMGATGGSSEAEGKRKEA